MTHLAKNDLWRLRSNKRKIFRDTNFFYLLFSSDCPFFDIINVEKLIIFQTVLNLSCHSLRSIANVSFTLTMIINAFYYRHDAPKEVHLPRKIPLRISIFSSTYERCWNISGWTKGAGLDWLAIQKSSDYPGNDFKEYSSVISQTSNKATLLKQRF